MSTDIAMHDLTESVVTIASDFFAALITGDYESVVEVAPGTHTMTDTLYAWVDVVDGFSARALLTTEASTADLIARALLDMEADEPVTQADLTDAFGEMANVVGGNIKSLLPEQGRLTLPTVSTHMPLTDSAPDSVVELDWAGRGLQISLWQF